MSERLERRIRWWRTSLGRIEAQGFHLWDGKGLAPRRDPEEVLPKQASVGGSIRRSRRNGGAHLVTRADLSEPGIDVLAPPSTELEGRDQELLRGERGAGPTTRCRRSSAISTSFSGSTRTSWMGELLMAVLGAVGGSFEACGEGREGFSLACSMRRDHAVELSRFASLKNALLDDKSTQF